MATILKVRDELGMRLAPLEMSHWAFLARFAARCHDPPTQHQAGRHLVPAAAWRRLRDHRALEQDQGGVGANDSPPLKPGGQIGVNQDASDGEAAMPVRMTRRRRELRRAASDTITTLPTGGFAAAAQSSLECRTRCSFR